MSKLVRTLDSLQLQDGRPDVEARRFELDSLVRSLAVAEIRRLRLQLNSLPNDICELPTEILLCIAEYLDLEEILSAKSVSRTWNKTFSSPEFCIGIIKTHFRPAWEQHYRRLSSAQQPIEKESLGQWLSEAAKDRVRRLNGRYHSMCIYRQIGCTVEDWQYNNGRIAFRRGPRAFIVRDLRTELEVTYMDEENRVDFGSWLLSEDYLLAVKNGPVSLRAWPLTNPRAGNYESIRLPGPILRIGARRKQVGIVTTTFQILIWCIGGPLRSVDNSGLIDYLTDFRSTQALVVFHPVEEDCFFVVYEAVQKGRFVSREHTRRIVIQEFTEKRLIATKSLDLHFSDAEPHRIIGPLHDGIIGISKVSVHRSSTEVESKADVTHPHRGLCQDEGNHSSSNRFVMAMYDIYRRKFVLEDYYLPSSLQGGHQWDGLLEQAFYWRNQILACGTALAMEHIPLGVTNTLLVAINPPKVRPSPQKIPWYGPGDNQVHLAQAENPSDIAYYWIGGADLASSTAINSLYQGSNRSRNSHYAIVQGDDDFVVSLDRDGWVVRCFAREVKRMV